jgi:hypothetical protein
MLGKARVFWCSQRHTPKTRRALYCEVPRYLQVKLPAPVVLRVFFVTVLLAPMFFSTHGHALCKVTGTRLLHDCRAAVKSTDLNPELSLEEDRAADRCISYVQGVLDTNEIWRFIDVQNQNKMAHYCIEADTSLEQVIRILVRYLEANPKELTEAGWVCIQAALLKSYPCGKH